MAWTTLSNAWLDGTNGRPAIALKHPIRTNFGISGMVRRPFGIVLHIMQGNERGTFNAFNHFYPPRQQRSAHFGNPRQGPMWQYVSLRDLAWAQGNGLYWVSVENAGWVGSASHRTDAQGNSYNELTQSQIHNLGMLTAYLWIYHQIEMRLANNPEERGIGYHSMGGSAWGAGPNGHRGCPGTQIINQRQAVLDHAAMLIARGFPVSVTS